MKIVELFAGVGGFRLGIERAAKKLNVETEVVFANQWEPGRKVQHAYDCYVNNFGYENTNNEDIAISKYKVPEDVDLLVGGFPCQDYSVASTNAKGIEGKKGVLWWEISWILKNKRPKSFLLENVDRLIKSPSKKRGRDFAIMLKNLDNLGYDIEWRVINAADYGMVQRRKRIFIWGVRKDSELNIDSFYNYDTNEYQFNNSVFNKKFKINPIEGENNFIDLRSNFKDELEVSESISSFNFYNNGYMKDGKVFSCKAVPLYRGEPKTLKSILDKDVDEKYYLNFAQRSKNTFVKGSKKIPRTKPNGEAYFYSEGAMSESDDINKPGRTMLTSEGTINRSSHIIKEGKRLRFITPTEAEKLNNFPKNWTKSIPTERMRYFCMGNALVVDIVENLSKEIISSIKQKFNKLNFEVSEKIFINNH